MPYICLKVIIWCKCTHILPNCSAIHMISLRQDKTKGWLLVVTTVNQPYLSHYLKHSKIALSAQIATRLDTDLAVLSSLAVCLVCGSTLASSGSTVPHWQGFCGGWMGTCHGSPKEHSNCSRVIFKIKESQGNFTDYMSMRLKLIRIVYN